MFRTVRFTTAALITSCVTLWACSSADAQVYDVQVGGVAPEDIPELGIEAGDPAFFGVTLDFTRTVPVHPNPVSSFYGGVPGGDAALAIDNPGVFQYADGGGVTADVLIDGGFHFVEFHIQDGDPLVEVGGSDIGATDVQISIVLGDLTGDALFPTGDLLDLPGLGDQLDTFEVRQFHVVVETERGGFPGDFFITGIDASEVDPPEPAYIHKFLIDGPDSNGDGEIDVIIEANSKEPSTYTFRIEVNQPDQPPMAVLDFIPKSWRIVSCEPDNPVDLVKVHPHALREYGFTPYTDGWMLEWIPADNTGGLTCTIETRGRVACGFVRINFGAQAFGVAEKRRLLDSEGRPLITDGIEIGAVKDKDHDGVIDGSGNGDEDEDGLTDAEEIFLVRTDPCKIDTDHDHVDDGNDRYPLDKERW